MIDFTELLRENTYPGRGIAMGTTAGGKSIAVYFIMGRSVNSRNRVFEETEDGIRTKAWDETKVVDPSLIIYNPVREYEGRLIVTNGDQTDTILEYLKNDRCMRAALRTREYEPDAPNYTPRISGVLEDDGSFTLSVLKKCGDGCGRFFYEFPPCERGTARFISTYEKDGDPLPSFAGEPVLVNLPDDPDDIWEGLNADNKVSLYVNIGGEVKLYNKFN